jgi:hypothetical protein
MILPSATLTTESETEPFVLQSLHWVRTFHTVFKTARQAGRTRRRSDAWPPLPLSLCGDHADAHRLARTAKSPGRPRHGRPGPSVDHGYRRPASGSWARGVTGTRRRSAGYAPCGVAPPAGARLAPGRPRSAHALRWVGSGASHPARHRPGQAEQTAARTASLRTHVKVRLTWRPERRPAPQRAGRRHTGWHQ